MTGIHERFWAKVDVSGECWAWTGSRNAKGYGRFNIGGRVEKAHRVAFELHHGRPPKGLCCHRCDNPWCVRPEHLFEGTPAENSADMVYKGRAVQRGLPGEASGNAKLTDDAVRQIRALRAQGVSQRETARRFSVSQGTVSFITSGKTWRHVQ